ncbi:MAG: M48 family peptidase, partial [Pseudomonadota bacterium]|nr:M48 family peptidase [Pseudomonadota bacterium]
MRNAISPFVAVVAAIATFSLHFALAQKTALAGNIRDAEIEHTIGFYAAPLLKAAGLLPEDLKFHIVNDRGI